MSLGLQTERRAELSAVNVLFCGMMTFYHIAPQTLASLDPLSWQYAAVLALQRLGCVALPGFFFLSGLKFALTSGKKGLLPYYWSRVRRLLIPYAAACGVYYGVFVWLRWYSFDWREFIRLTLCGGLSAQLYFVIALVQFALLAPVFRHLTERYSPAILLPLALVITQLSGPLFSHLAQCFPHTPLPSYANSIFTNFLFYYLAGCFAGARYGQFREMLVNHRLPIGVTALTALCADQLASILHYSGRISLPYLESIHMLYYIAGTLLLCALPTPSWSGLKGALLRGADQASYHVYLYHCLIIVLFNLWAPILGLRGAGLQLLLRTIVTFAVSNGGSLLWQWLWRKIRRHPELSSKETYL